MVTVRLFGMFRLETGLKEVSLEADKVKELYPLLAKSAGRKFEKKYFENCVVVVNGAPAGNQTALKDGDLVFLTTPMAGG